MLACFVTVHTQSHLAKNLLIDIMRNGVTKPSRKHGFTDKAKEEAAAPLLLSIPNKILIFPT